MLLVHRHTISHGATGQVIFKPVHVAADIGHALVVPKSFHDIGPAFFVESECDRVGQHRLGGHELHLCPCRQAKAGDGIFAFVGSLGHGRTILVGDLGDISCKAGQRRC